MILRTAVAVRRWWLPLVLAALAAVAGWYAGSADASIPAADGPRVVRQYLVVGLPCLAAPILIDRLPEVSVALRREPVLRTLDQLVVVLTIAIVLAVAWVRTDVSRDTFLYELLVAVLLLAWVLAGTARWGLSAVLGASLVAMGWLLAGDTVAWLLGFGDLGRRLEGMPPIGISVRAWAALGLAAVALPICFGLGRSWRWRRS